MLLPLETMRARSQEPGAVNLDISKCKNEWLIKFIQITTAILAKIYETNFSVSVK